MKDEEWKVGDRVAVVPIAQRHGDHHVDSLVKTGYLKSRTLLCWVVALDQEHDGKLTMLAKEHQLVKR